MSRCRCDEPERDKNWNMSGCEELRGLKHQNQQLEAMNKALVDQLAKVSSFSPAPIMLANGQAWRAGYEAAKGQAIAEWGKPYGLTDGSKFIDRLRAMQPDLPEKNEGEKSGEKSGDPGEWDGCGAADPRFLARQEV